MIWVYKFSDKLLANLLHLNVMKKEKLTIELANPRLRDQLLEEFTECIGFATASAYTYLLYRDELFNISCSTLCEQTPHARLATLKWSSSTPNCRPERAIQPICAHAWVGSKLAALAHIISTCHIASRKHEPALWEWDVLAASLWFACER